MHIQVAVAPQAVPHTQAQWHSVRHTIVHCAQGPSLAIGATGTGSDAACPTQSLEQVGARRRRDSSERTNEACTHTHTHTHRHKCVHT